MRVKPYLIIALVILCITATLLQSGQEKKDPSDLRSFVRVDLLPAGKSEMKPPLRNIFAPHLSGPADTEGIEGRPQDLEEVIGDASEGETDESSEPGFLNFDLSYLGYVRSAAKIIAVIVFEGRAAAVESGEFIAPDFQVAEITNEEIVIEGPGGSRHRFPLQEKQ